MSESFLYRRLVVGVPGSTGTISEPNGTPEPRFALQATVNWMRALTILANDQGVDWASMGSFYAHVQGATLSEPVVNTVFEQLLMSLHHLAALRAMVEADSDRNFARVAVMTWYYGIYCAASAMVAAKDGSLQDDHAGTANQWDHQIAACRLIREVSASVRSGNCVALFLGGIYPCFTSFRRLCCDAAAVAPVVG